MKRAVFFAVFALLLFSCDKENKVNPQEQIESGDPVVTAEAAEVTMNSAILYGYLNPEFLLVGGENGFIISTSSTPSLDNGQKVVSSEVDKNGKYFVRVSGLTPSTTYYYKAFLNIGTTNLVGEIKSFTTKQVVFVFEAVDLGLSVKWANANLGATSPEGYGDYYAWGETKPKSDYTWYTYTWCGGSETTLTKYCPSDKTYYWDGSGSPDGKTVLDPEDDAAHMNWGENWRMPTYAEWDELMNNCTWTWTSNYNGTGIKGYIVTSIKTGYTNKCIFLPAAGNRNDTGLSGVGSSGRYWSSHRESYPVYASYVVFSSGNVGRSGSDRCNGLSVRPVTE